MFISNIAQLSGPLFGYHPEETTPQRYNFWGQSGWFTVPRGWNIRNINGLTQASPNPDFSTPLYTCELTPDGYLVFQDELLGTSHRDIWPNGIHPPTW